ncbi:hypothetical protein D9611_014863 [Ephemerocybe angulata]|uniref:F-box domain-containing protein n=1 Tax=Ephemerocybe angulata TaxID=980116 RepID=A0A8H5B7X4_9AGAR|nr:hypothetical protein D9611_014863 [Tulosesus angulatus]
MTSITGSFQHLQKTFSKQLQYTSPCPGEEALKMSPTTLSELPIELLTKVFMNLELNDILRARTCKSHPPGLEITRFEEYRDNAPTTVLLSETSSGMLFFGYRVFDQTVGGRLGIEEPWRLFCALSSWKGSGQFAIAGMTDGSVWAYNLFDDPASSSTVRAKLLVRAPFPSQNRMQLHLAMDYVSDEALGDTRGIYCLSQFNLAVIALPRAPPNGLRIANISVWRICISRPGNAGTSGRHEINLGGRLASFMVMADAGFFGLSLYGKAIAYGLFFPLGSRCTVIAQWQDANGKKEHDEFLRWYIQDTLPMKRSYPGGQRVRHFHFFPIPHERHHSTCGSHKRSTALTDNSVDGDNSQAGAIQESQLLLRASDFCPSGRFAAPWYFELGFCRAVGIHGGKDLSAIYAVQYRVEDDHVPETAPYQPTYERHPHTFDRRPSHILYDQFTNRVVLTDIKLSHFITLSSHASHAVDDDEVLVEGREDDMVEGTFPSAAN